MKGRRISLEKSTLALEIGEDKRRVVTIPAGAIVEVISGPPGDTDRMVEVAWDGKVVSMFAIDVDARGTDISDRGAAA